MASIGSLLMLDYRVDELRDRIKIESERVAQMEIEGREPSKSRESLAALEQSLEAMLVQRDKIVRELESGRPANFRRAVG
jgi:predicted  nucleic acid-binding Zn-ribbon protein